MSSSSQITVPVPDPFVVAPTYIFEGNDGNWSSFALSVGTPTQLFHIFPATVGQEVWVPAYAACMGKFSQVPHCNLTRGIENINSTGFNPGAWTNLGYYDLSTSTNLYGGQNAAYGLDTIALANASSGSNTTISSQIIAAYTTDQYWFGQLGLGALPGEFGTKQYPSPLYSMTANNLTSSLSYGYTAGKYYSNTPGSLILGGYDAARISGDTLSLPISSTSFPVSLEVNVTEITTTQTLQGNFQNLSPNSSLTMNIDSSTSQIWLPPDVCSEFANAFGLQLDSTSLLYTVNSTVHSQLQALNPTFFFQLESNGTTVSISIPYSAFDLSFNLPYNYTSTSYFPIRQGTANQLTLGRAFLQEAYIIVDWERRNLTIGQAASQNSTIDVKPILPVAGARPSPSSSPSMPNSPQKSGGSSAGAIAGGVVGGIAALAIILGIVWWIRRRKRNQQVKDAEKTPLEPSPVPAEYYRDEVAKPPPPQNPEPEQQVAEYYPPEKRGGQENDKAGGVDEQYYEMHSPEVGPAELASTPLHELPGVVHNRDELMSTPLHEMPGSEVGSELGVGASRSVRSPAFRSVDSPSPDVFGTPPPERYMSPIGSSSSVQLGPSSAVHHFSSSHQEVVSSSEIVSNSAERDRLGGASSEIVVNSSPNEVASPLPVRETSSPLATQPAEDLVHSHVQKAD